MSSTQIRKTRIGDVPVLWVEPAASAGKRELILFLPSFGGSKEQVLDQLQDLASRGFVGMSFDPPEHGERGAESPKELATRVFSSFRRYMWPILGQTTLDCLRVIEWATSSLEVDSRIRLGGLSMGGDVAVAAAGLEGKVSRVVAVVATPDWLRPGMHDAFDVTKLINQGDSTTYGKFFCDTLNPAGHLGRYEREFEINFLCGELDKHIPPDGALNFQRSLAATGSKAARINVEFIAQLAHMDVRDSSRWWPRCREQLVAPWPLAWAAR
jgi:dienelactone hydrolase